MEVSSPAFGPTAAAAPIRHPEWIAPAVNRATINGRYRFEPDFVESVATDIACCLAEYSNPEIVLHVYRSPWDPDCEPQGQILLCAIGDDDAQCAIAIVFGAPFETAGSDHRSVMDVESFKSDPMDPYSSGVVAANFDECWAIICRSLQGITPRSVQLAFGN